MLHIVLEDMYEGGGLILIVVAALYQLKPDHQKFKKYYLGSILTTKGYTYGGGGESVILKCFILCQT